MSGTNNQLNNQTARAPDASSSLPSSIPVNKLYLSHLLEDNDNKGILITSVKIGNIYENRISLKLDHPDNFGDLQLSYTGPRCHDYFPSNATFKVKEILLKKSRTIRKDIYDGDWNIIHIITEKESDCSYLFEKAIDDKYTFILAIRLEIINANNSSRDLTLYLHDDNGTLLHRAVVKNDIKTIKTLIDYKLDINARNNMGWTPLYAAVFFKKVNIVDLIISNGADVNIQDMSGETPLFCAVAVESVDIVDILLKKGANYKLEDKFYCPPFHLAVKNKHLDIINVFFKNNLDANILDSRGQTPLFYVLRKSWLEPKYLDKEIYLKFINVLLKNGANINCKGLYGRTPLQYTVVNDNIECMQALLECNADVSIQNDFKCNVLHLACGYIRDECIQVLMNYNIDINAVDFEKRTALHKIVMIQLYVVEKIAGQTRIILLLLKHKADVNLKERLGKTVLHLASENPDINIDIIELISNSTNDIHAKDNYGRTAFYYAALSNNFSTLEYLLEKNADVNAKDCDGRTPLHATMEFNNKCTFVKCVKILLDHKADINAIDNNLISPLHLACFFKNTEAIKYLIENGADSSMRDKDGRTVFHYACMLKLGEYDIKEYVKNILNVLVKENISINYVDKFGKTPLHYAAANDDLFFMNELLLNIGADINIVDKNHNSPFDNFIKRKNRIENDPILTLFKKHIIKMKILELWVRERILDKIYKVDDVEDLKWIQSYEIHCNKEIDSMKNTNLDDNNITYYDFLKKKPHDVVNCIRNKNIVETVQSDELLTKFPIYGHFIKCHLREVQRRSSLYEKIQESLEPYIFEKLPTVRINEILKYSGNSDLNLNVLFELMKPGIL